MIRINGVKIFSVLVDIVWSIVDEDIEDVSL
jgi:hypothetical protein